MHTSIMTILNFYRRLLFILALNLFYLNFSFAEDIDKAFPIEVVKKSIKIDDWCYYEAEHLFNLYGKQKVQKNYLAEFTKSEKCKSEKLINSTILGEEIESFETFVDVTRLLIEKKLQHKTLSLGENTLSDFVVPKMLLTLSLSGKVLLTRNYYKEKVFEAKWNYEAEKLILTNYKVLDKSSEIIVD